MSCYFIYYAGGAKMMRPVETAEDYRALRNSERNRRADKQRMAQMNYSCLPNADGSLRGATRMSRSVGMDIDFDPSDPDYVRKMADVPKRVFGRKDELGLLMLERSATKGYHVVFRRRPGLTQEENLRWAAELLGVAYDKGAKDVTRVFFTPPTDRLLFLSDELFDNEEAASPRPHDGAAAPRNVAAPPAPASANQRSPVPPTNIKMAPMARISSVPERCGSSSISADTTPRMAANGSTPTEKLPMPG